MRRLKVLSIDFDFFQDVDAHTMKYYYPDGVDLPTNLSTIVWGSKYSKRYQYSEKISSVKINLELFAQMLTILDNQDMDTPMLITQSHVSIYDFIHEHMEEYNGVYVVNVDMHHDIFNDNPEVDCGNWLYHIAHEIPNTKIKWITREVSLECYDIKPEDNLKAEFNFNKIKNTEFDIIFLCRSDAWLPPHLDEWFEKMVNHCVSNFYNVRAQKCILNPRDVSDIMELEDKLYEEMLKMEASNVNDNPITKQED